MGVLKNITDEYFWEKTRKEDIIQMYGVEIRPFTDKNGKFHKNGYRVENGKKETLEILLERLIEKRGLEADYNDIDVSNIKDMSGLFMGFDIFDNNNTMADFNGDITGWDVSNVCNMAYMFCGSKKFNQPIGKWNVSRVTKMNGIFKLAIKFNQPIGDWKVNNVMDMGYMFYHADSFNQPIGDWKVKNVMYMNYMFSNAINFDQDISKWNVNGVTYAANMFDNCPIKDEHKPKKFRE